MQNIQSTINCTTLNGQSTRVPLIIQSFPRSVLSDVGKLAIGVALGITNKAMKEHTLRFDNDKDDRGLYPFVRISYPKFKKYNGDGYKSVHHGLLQAQKLGIIKLHKPNYFTRTIKIEFVCYTHYFQNAKSHVAKTTTPNITNKYITNSKQSTKHSKTTKHLAQQDLSMSTSNTRYTGNGQKTAINLQNENEIKRQRSNQKYRANCKYILSRSHHLQSSMGLPAPVTDMIARISKDSFATFKKLRGLLDNVRNHVQRCYSKLTDPKLVGVHSKQYIYYALRFDVNKFFMRYNGKSFAGKLKYIVKTAFMTLGANTKAAWKYINKSLQNYYLEAVMNYQGDSDNSDFDFVNTDPVRQDNTNEPTSADDLNDQHPNLHPTGKALLKKCKAGLEALNNKDNAKDQSSKQNNNGSTDKKFDKAYQNFIDTAF